MESTQPPVADRGEKPVANMVNACSFFYSSFFLINNKNEQRSKLIEKIKFLIVGYFFHLGGKLLIMM